MNFSFVHTLAVLRCLRFERLILHRDISKGNIMYLQDGPASLTGTKSDTEVAGFNETVGSKEEPLCFIKYLLGERYVEVSRNLVVDTNATRNQAMTRTKLRHCSLTSTMRKTSRVKRFLTAIEPSEQFVAFNLYLRAALICDVIGHTCFHCSCC
jgi:hypothetical protein